MEIENGAPGFGRSDAEHFRLCVNGVADYAICVLTPDGHIKSWNAGAQRFNGYTAEEIIGQHFSRFYTEEERVNGKPARVLRVAREQGKFEEEGWQVRKDGIRFWASDVIDAIRDTGGNLIGFAKVARAITERHHASEERFRLLVQGVTDYAIFMLSPSGQVTNWNSGAQRIKGYAADEVIGSHFSRFYTDEDCASGLPARALKSALKEGRFEQEGWRVRRDGTRFWASVVIDPIRNEVGEHIGFAKVTRDITERRDAALSLERAREALFQAQKLEAIGKLTGGVAHDVNNLLAVIVSGLDLVSPRLQSLADARILESMQGAAERGAKLMQQLLMFARQQPLHQEKHNLNRVITAFEAVLRRVAHEPHLVNLMLSPQLCLVLTDSTQFEAGILNLVTNACDAMPGGGALTIQTENVSVGHQEVNQLPAGPYVKVTVRDTGSGMSPDVLARATEPFFTTKDPGKGTGLGLSQVFGLVKQCQGDLEIETTLGKGTAVRLYFPAVAAMGDAAAASDEAESNNERVLVVDDQMDVLEMAVELFKILGFDVMSANNGTDALGILQHNPDITVLFTDVRMPGMNGVTLGHEARKLLPGIHVVLASGFPGPAYVDERVSGADFAFLKKPYRLADLVKTLRQGR